jgi:hypothetical protein
LDKDRFWSVIESSRIGADGDQDAQVSALCARLQALTVAEIEEFDAQYRRAMADAYRWDLWAAAYVMLGGCSDDGFHYFCDWLISMGRECFEAALRNPDSLATYIEDMDGDEEAFEFEDFGSAAGHVWERKTGKDILEMPDSGVKWPSSPAGEPWDESEEYFSAAFPQLWARFGY